MRIFFVAVPVLLLTSNVFGQRPFSDASPQTDRNEENKRIAKFGYTTSSEYRVADSAGDPKEGDLNRVFEYGKSGLLTSETEFAKDDTTKTNYQYDASEKITEINTLNSGNEATRAYMYGKNGLLESFMVASAESRQFEVKHNPDGTIKECDGQMPRLDMDENGNIKEPQKLIYSPFEKVEYTYNKNKRPISETTSLISDGKNYTVSYQLKYSYDAAGRIVRINKVNEHTEDFIYDAAGNLSQRVISYGNDKTYFKFIYF